MPAPARFFRSHPGWLFTLRLCVFAVALPWLACHYIATGDIPVGHDVGPIARAINPELYWVLVVIVAGTGPFVTVVSTIIFLKKKRLIRRNWKLFGMDARF